MNAMPSHIKLYSEKQERFEEIKRDLTEELGYEPTNPEVIGFLMARYGEEADRRPDPLDQRIDSASSGSSPS